MKKDYIRDYSVAMFQFYYENGQPSIDEIENTKHKYKPPDILDLCAVAKAFEILDRRGKILTVAAVKEIYFIKTNRSFYKKEISDRVIRFALHYHISEQAVWQMLKEARRLCAEQRGLRV